MRTCRSTRRLLCVSGQRLQALPLEQRAALILRTAGDLSHDEIAYVLDLAPAETRNLLVKARVALAEAGQ